jgi:hypothetical protein
MGENDDPRLGEQQVADLLMERDVLVIEHGRLSARIDEIDRRLHASGEAKVWDRRKRAIRAVIALIDGASEAVLGSWLARTSFPGPLMTRTELRALLSGAERDVQLYDAWIAATQIRSVSEVMQS